MTFTTHRARMVSHFIWLEGKSPAYAVEALTRYRTDPNCPCPDILTDIKKEKARRAESPMKENTK